MKISLSSTTVSAGGSKLVILLLLLSVFFFSSANYRLHNHHPHHRYCDSFSKRYSRSLCMEIQRIHNRLHDPVPPSQENGIDPRFGAEKRLVPSGPNPLHN